LDPVFPENKATHDLQRRTRRTQIEIIVAILEAALLGATKTALVYRSNLNFTLVERYIYLLETKGLLYAARAPEDRHSGGLYKTSAKGLEALATLRDAISLAFEETDR
jgi:predicted transcriptional regulator